MLLAGCWAHARRGFYEALEHAPKEAAWVLNQIGHLYDIERSLRRQRAGPVLRDAYRTSQSVPICRRIHRVLQRWYISRRFLPRSTMGKAVSYTLAQWESLAVYLKEPEIEIDSNLVENAIRPTALGKKNWLFFGDAGAGERSLLSRKRPGSGQESRPTYDVMMDRNLLSRLQGRSRNRTGV